MGGPRKQPHLSFPDPPNARHSRERDSTEEAPEQVRRAHGRRHVGKQQRQRQHHRQQNAVSRPHPPLAAVAIAAHTNG